MNPTADKNHDQGDALLPNFRTILSEHSLARKSVRFHNLDAAYWTFEYPESVRTVVP
jgi:hypothetical protein